MKCSTTGKIAHWLIVISALNLGLVGLGGFFGGNWNVLNLIFGSVPILEGIVYILVGISAVMCIFTCKCKGSCSARGNQQM